MLDQVFRITSLLCLAQVSAAEAAPFSRRASLAVLDVPVAETVGRASATFGLEFFVERDRAGWGALPLPLSVVAGVGERLDVGFSAQFGGLPGDAVTAGVPVLQWTLATKYLVLRQVGWVPALAIEAQVDRPTTNLRLALRGVASAALVGPLRAAVFAGVELGIDPVAAAPTGGLAVLARHLSGLEGFAEALYSSRGFLAGVGARWAVAEHLGFTASATWIPQEATVRASLGIAIFLEAPPPVAPPPVQVVEGQPTTLVAGGPRQYSDDRPQLRLRIRAPRAATDPAGRHYQYGPGEPGEFDDGPAVLRPPVAPPAKDAEPPPTPDIPWPGEEAP